MSYTLQDLTDAMDSYVLYDPVTGQHVIGPYTLFGWISTSDIDPPNPPVEVTSIERVDNFGALVDGGPNEQLMPEYLCGLMTADGKICAVRTYTSEVVSTYVP